jgi:predicted ester cyclase
MTPDEMKRLARRAMTKIVSEGRVELIDELLVPDYVEHDPDRDLEGRAEQRALVGRIRTAFPDLRIEILDTMAEGDRVLTVERWRGTHQGAWAGIAATGLTVERDYVHVWRCRDGRLAEEWGWGGGLGTAIRAAATLSGLELRSASG